MSAPNVIRGVMWEGEAPPPIVLRLVADDGQTALKLSDPTYGISTVELRVRDAYDADEAILVTKSLSGVGALTGIVFDTLQTDGYAFDDVGYNFRHQLTEAEASVLVGGRSYTFEYQIVPTAQKKQVHVAWIQVVSTGY